MTGRAGNNLVRALQRESRFAVIERLCLAPFCGGMTAVAAFSQPALMWVELLVTVEADRRCLAKSLLFRMASVAWDALVRVDQLEIRLIVVECLSVELIDVGAASLVLGVALIALQCRGSPLPSVKSLLLGAVVRDILVAIETEPGLRMSRERLVAF